MSGSQKALKVLSIIMIVMAVFCIVLGALMMGGSQLEGLSGSVDIDGVVTNASDAVLALGLVMVVSAVVDLVIAVLGLRGASDPKKIGPYFVLTVIGTAWYAINFIAGLAMGAFDPNILISLIIVIVCLALAWNIKKQNA